MGLHYHSYLLWMLLHSIIIHLLALSQSILLLETLHSVLIDIYTYKA